MKKLKLLLLLFIGSFWLCNINVANTYYISTSGNDNTGNNSQANPWQTIIKVNSVVLPGDTVYFKNTDTWTGGSGTALLSAVGGVIYDGKTWGSGYKAKLKATGKFTQAVALIADDHATYETVIKGFEIDCNGSTESPLQNNGANINWPTSYTLTGATKKLESLDIHNLYQGATGTYYNIKAGATGTTTTRNVGIIGNHIYNTDTQCIAIYASVNNPNCLIDQVLVSGNTVGPKCYPASLNWNGTGILCKNNTQHVTIEYNTVYETALNNILIQDDNKSGTNGNRGLIIRYNILYNIKGPENKHGISFQTPGGADVSVYGNIIYGNGKYGINFASTCGGTIKARIYNNTIYNNGWGEVGIDNSSANFSQLEFKNNIFYPTGIKGSADKITTKSNNLTDNPIFKNTSDLPTGFIGKYGVDIYPNSNGLSIESNAAIDGGVDLGAEYNKAINSVVRTGQWDIGAYEYHKYYTRKIVKE